MPISLDIPQSTGVVAKYHKATGGGFGATSLKCNILSFLDSEHTDLQGFEPVAQTIIDCSMVMPTVASSPPPGATVSQVVFGIVENFAINQQTSNLNSTVENPLAPINGVFYGGVLVS